MHHVGFSVPHQLAGGHAREARQGFGPELGVGNQQRAKFCLGTIEYLEHLTQPHLSLRRDDAGGSRKSITTQPQRAGDFGPGCLQLRSHRAGGEASVRGEIL